MSDSEDQFLENLRRALTPSAPKPREFKTRLFRKPPPEGVPYYVVTLQGECPLATWRRDTESTVEVCGLLAGENYVPCEYLPDAVLPRALESRIHEIHVSEATAAPVYKAPAPVALLVKNAAQPLDTLMIGRNVLHASPQQKMLIREDSIGACLDDLHGWLRLGKIAISSASEAQLAAATAPRQPKENIAASEVRAAD